MSEPLVMFGSFRAHPGKRNDLIKVMLDGQVEMDGCTLYLIGPDPDDDDAVNIVERWRDKLAHEASLQIPEVRATIQKAMPLIADMSHTQFTPSGGIGY